MAATVRNITFGATLTATLLAAGCGTTRWTDTARSGTEQLLISDAVDRAVSQIHFAELAGHAVFFDTTYLKLSNPMYNFDDNNYLVSSLRQHLLASGCVLKEKREDAEFVVEARAGGVGTDRHDLLYGVPATNLSGVMPVQGVPATIPEVPLAKKTVQRGVCKVAVFAYHRETGKPVWQSGAFQVASNARNTWVFGIGPFQSGTVYDGTRFADRAIPNPLSQATDESGRPLWVTKEARFNDPRTLADSTKPPAAAASATATAPTATAPSAAPTAKPTTAAAAPTPTPVPQPLPPTSPTISPPSTSRQPPIDRTQR